jgi:peptide/nickel transport system permease protein
VTTTPLAEPIWHGEAGRRRALRRWRRAPAGRILAIGVLAAIVGLAALAPLFASDPNAVDAAGQLESPSRSHLFGTDQFGLDVFSRVIYGARIDLTVAVIASALALIVGMPLGALAALRRGWLDLLMMRIAEAFQAFPALLLAMGVAAALGSSLRNLVFIIAIVNAPVYFRLTRNAVLPLRDADYVVMARAAGRNTRQILFGHVLPNVREVAVAQFSVNCAWAIQILAGLSFIGIGVRLPTAEWGSMVRLGTDYIVTGQWWVSVFPGLAIIVTVLALNEIADSLRRDVALRR